MRQICKYEELRCCTQQIIAQQEDRTRVSRASLGATTQTTSSPGAPCTYQALAIGTYWDHIAGVASNEADNIGVALTVVALGHIFAQYNSEACLGLATTALSGCVNTSCRRRLSFWGACVRRSRNISKVVLSSSHDRAIYTSKAIYKTTVMHDTIL